MTNSIVVFCRQLLRFSVFLQGKQTRVVGFGNVRALDSAVYLKVEAR